MDTQTITHSQLLADVTAEINALRTHATPEELSRLNLEDFNPNRSAQCIYGQMTGNCTNVRAHGLMNRACVRVMNTPDGAHVLDRLASDSPKFIKYINGLYNGQTWNTKGIFRQRSFLYLSVLEAFILTSDANIPGILSYLKGETDELKLQL